jgi:hypothetical protein
MYKNTNMNRKQFEGGIPVDHCVSGMRGKAAENRITGADGCGKGGLNRKIANQVVHCPNTNSNCPTTKRFIQ